MESATLGDNPPYLALGVIGAEEEESLGLNSPTKLLEAFDLNLAFSFRFKSSAFFSPVFNSQSPSLSRESKG